MGFNSQYRLASLSDAEFDQLLNSSTHWGYHPETNDAFLTPKRDRFAGTYMLGVQGVGKSGLLQNLISQDIHAGHSVIVIDPHGDLADDCIRQLPEEALERTYLLDIEDVAHPFGINLFGASMPVDNPIAHAQAVDRVMHVFDVLWPEVMSQQHFPRFLRAAVMVLLDNPGTTLVDMHTFLTDEMVREQMLQAVTDATVRQFWQAFDELSPSAQRQNIEPLVGRLESLFMGRSIVRNIVGQRETSIDFRKAIENKEIIFIKLPIKTLGQDARLIGTKIIALIHAAIFSFADMPESSRPGFSLFVDEFQNFATADFSEMFTEGRKFGVRVCIAHQYRAQVPSFLQESTRTARTKICFQLVREDASEMAHYFLNGEATVQPEDDPSKHLLKYGSDDPKVQRFIDTYLRPIQRFIHGGSVEIRKPGLRFDHAPFYLLGVKPPEEKVLVPDPLPHLDHLLYKVMSTGDDLMPIAPEIVYGFSNCGGGFFSAFRFAMNKPRLLSSEIQFPLYLVAYRANGESYWVRTPENGKEWLLHLLYYLRSTMTYLADNPIGKKVVLSASDVAGMLTQLPRRAAFVRAGEDVGVIYTDDTPPIVDTSTFHERMEVIHAQTRQKYCRAKSDIGKEPVATTVDELEDTMPRLNIVTPTSRWEEVE